MKSLNCNLKILKIFKFSLVVVMCFFFMFCSRTESIDSLNITEVNYEGVKHFIDSDDSFAGLLKEILDQSDINVKDYFLAQFTDKEGSSFWAYQANYFQKGNENTIIIPLFNSHISTKTGGSGVGPFEVECTMMCTAGEYCESCTQIVYKKCASQTCDCHEDFGSCSSSIIF